MYIQSSSSFLYSAQDERTFSPKQAGVQTEQNRPKQLQNFSEKANLTFENLTLLMDSQEKGRAADALNSIGKSAAFAAMNGYESQEERLVVSQYFGNFSGVLSDDAIKKMIFAKLNNPAYEQRDFLEEFATALDEPLQHINIMV